MILLNWVFVFLLGFITTYLTSKMEEQNSKIVKAVIKNFVYSLLVCLVIWSLYILFENSDKTTILELNLSSGILSDLLVIFCVSFFVLFLYEIISIYFKKTNQKKVLNFRRKLKLSKVGLIKIIQIIYLILVIIFTILINSYERKDNYFKEDTVGYFEQVVSQKVILKKINEKWTLEDTNIQNVKINSENSTLVLNKDKVNSVSLLDDSADFQVTKSEIIIPLENFKNQKKVEFSIEINEKIEVNIPKNTIYYFKYQQKVSRKQSDFEYQHEDNQFLLPNHSTITLKKGTILKLTPNNSDKIFLLNSSGKHSTIYFNPLYSKIKLNRDKSVHLLKDSPVIIQSASTAINQAQLAMIPVYFIALFLILRDVFSVYRLIQRRQKLVLGLSRKDK
ncbi:hypothetical protein [Streptococcus parasuis]|uniref:hypothetical protein n=1 Tax=Streptococcus parasuis TaxID=1501662 RepID=UPI0028A7EE93|nr:hypothetical protein [Streptococcus parasuis]